MDIQKQVNDNTDDIKHIKQNIHTIMTNHLYHIEKDMDKVKSDTEHLKDKIGDVDKKVDKMDNRIWWILGLLVTGIVIPALINGLQ
jgi:predicted  nucleic acid-binding Zn-ribbon protein